MRPIARLVAMLALAMLLTGCATVVTPADPDAWDGSARRGLVPADGVDE